MCFFQGTSAKGGVGFGLHGESSGRRPSDVMGSGAAAPRARGAPGEAAAGDAVGTESASSPGGRGDPWNPMYGSNFSLGGRLEHGIGGPATPWRLW